MAAANGITNEGIIKISNVLKLPCFGDTGVVASDVMGVVGKELEIVVTGVFEDVVTPVVDKSVVCVVVVAAALTRTPQVIKRFAEKDIVIATGSIVLSKIVH